MARKLFDIEPSKLHDPAQQIDFKTTDYKELKFFRQRLAHTAYKYHALGLAANQVGSELRACCVQMQHSGPGPDIDFYLQRGGYYGDISRQFVTIEEPIPYLLAPMNKSFEMYMLFYNPEIIEYSQETDLMDEGCLSFPGVTLPIIRSKSVIATWQNIRGKTFSMPLRGLFGRIFQHEIDHLNGITIYKRYEEQRNQNDNVETESRD